MHTPNYKLDKTARLCAVDAIDRELRRIEDKIDCRHPTGSGCAPHSLRKLCQLLEQKVDKKDGCRLVCEKELTALWCSIRDRYTKAEIDRFLEELRGELGQKADAGPLESHPLTFLAGYEEQSTGAKYHSYGFYTVNPNGLVIGTYRVTRNGGETFPAGKVIQFAAMPEELAPVTGVVFPPATLQLDGENLRSSYTAHVYIRGQQATGTAGYLTMHTPDIANIVVAEGSFSYYTNWEV